MNLFAGKSPTERNKIIAAVVLGVMAVTALGYSLVGNPFAAKKKTTVTVSASPKLPAAARTETANAALPTADETDFQYTTTRIEYNPIKFNAPDAGRNIFAFYEPPPPTPYSPTPTPPPPPIIVPAPVVTPTPPLLVGFVTPQSVYAGSKTFRLEVNGDKYTPDSQIYLNGNPLPTTYISPQKLVADVPSNFISGAGQIYIIVRTSGGLYSNQIAFNVQAPPTPQFQYVGMIARQKYNNDTAYFQEQGKPTPFGARLNDIVGGRFRLESISADEAVFEDVNLGFKHRLALYRPDIAQTGGGSGQSNPYPQNQMPTLGNPGRMPPNRGFDQSVPNNNLNSPNNPNNQKVPNAQPVTTQPGSIPGIPGSIQIYTPPQPQPPDQKDEDDDGNNR